ncbi:MAG TPA: tetratricopeptide repeat protein [Bryobacteraceae bacterium]|jgi:Flp pilus assembly protein TadD|nr:tetratricopeptide repeat protein [Bryobacteraceae bacterium]
MKKQAAPAKPAGDLWIYVGLAAAIFAAYGAVLRFGFVSYDDPVYIAGNPHVRDGVTGSGVVWAFTHSFAGNWFPLTWISHMLDCQFFGLDAGAHHFTNLALHTAATLLLFAVLRRITGARWRSAFVAALFALHPLHVESVAWIAERKDVLCAFCWMLTLLAYARYVTRPTGARYAWTLAAFALALLAKPMAITLPLVLMLLDYWPFARGFRILEKLPFLALSAAVSAVTYVAHAQANAVISLSRIPVAMRVENALISCAVYIGKMFWPGGLAVFYPYPKGSLVLPAALAGVALAAVTAAAIRFGRTRPYLPVGWLWYLVTLTPVIGLIQAGQQARADRYMYIPMIGLSILLAWGGAELLQPWPQARIALPAAACAACVVLTHIQAGYWENGVTLYSHAVEVTADNYIARFNLAHDLRARGDVAGAVEQLQAAVRIQPESGLAHDELGQLLGHEGHYDEALAELRRAESTLPDDATLHYRIGVLLASAGHSEQAVEELSQAARLDPANAEVHRNLAISLAMLDRLPESVGEFRAAVKLKPEDATLRFNLGVALLNLGQKSDAATQLEEALRLNPGLQEARAALDAARP